MKYLVVITGAYYLNYSSNALEKAILKILQAQDRKLMDARQLDKFRTALYKQFNKARADHPGLDCTAPLWDDRRVPGYPPDIRVTMGAGKNWSFTIYAITN